MIDLGLSSGEMTSYVTALTSTHKTRTTVDLLEMDHTLIQNLNTGDHLYFLSGEINIDAREHVSRALTMTILDPGKLSAIDPDSPTDDLLWVNRMIRVSIDTFVPGGLGWVQCPVFCGPITKVTPQGYTVEIEAHGKEELLLAPTRFWNTISYPRHALVGSIMRDILHKSGEDPSFIDFPTFTRRTQHPFNMLGVWPSWPVLNELADELNQQIFYDGSGTVRMRDFPDTSAFTFTYGRDLLTIPQMPIDYLQVRNGVQIRGKAPESGPQPIAMRYVGAGTSISSGVLGRNGEPRHIIKLMERDHMRLKSELQAQADTVLDRVQQEVSDLEFESFVMPFLDEWDRVQVQTDTQTFNLRMMKWTIPLSVDATMSVGFHHRTRITPKKHHKNRRHHHVIKGLPHHLPPRGVAPHRPGKPRAV